MCIWLFSFWASFKGLATLGATRSDSDSCSYMPFKMIRCSKWGNALVCVYQNNTRARSHSELLFMYALIYLYGFVFYSWLFRKRLENADNDVYTWRLKYMLVLETSMASYNNYFHIIPWQRRKWLCLNEICSWNSAIHLSCKVQFVIFIINQLYLPLGKTLPTWWWQCLRCNKWWHALLWQWTGC